jgi:hypothetical protein
MKEYEFRIVIQDNDATLIGEELTDEIRSVLEFFSYKVIDITLEDEYNVEQSES